MAALPALRFFNRLELPTDALRTCVPLYYHTDGVKIYKNQKAWIYSLASATRKGTSIKTKFVFVLFRDSMVVKDATHDAVGKLVAYISETLRTGRYPMVDPNNHPWPAGSTQAAKAGKMFCGGWTMAFAGFKGDWEARVIVHKLSRSYRSKFICEHCMASYNEQFTFCDFRLTASCLNLRFSHDDYLIMNSREKLSSWVAVKGWTKDRNLVDPLTSEAVVVLFCWIDI